MSLRRRLAVVLVAFVALMGLAAAALTLTIRARGDRSADMRKYAVTAEGAARLRSAYTDLETDQRGFIITGEPDFLEPYEAGQETVRKLIADAQARHPHDAALLSALDEVAAAGEAWKTSAAEPEIAVRESQGRVAAEQLVSSGQGQALFDQLRGALDRLDETAGRRFEEATNADLRLRRHQIGVMAATFALALGLLALAVVAMRRWVTEPLAAITYAAQAVRGGDIRRPIPVVGPADVRVLARTVDEMRQQMVTEIDRADRARQGVEQSASIVLQVQAVLTAEPSDIPEGWGAAAGLEPAEGLVAGDCYDLFRLGSTGLAVLVLDIAGHGASAALTALRCKEIVRAALRSDGEPGAALTALDQLTDDLEGDLFVTGFVAVIDHRSGEVAWANAGHPPALLRHGTELIELPPTGPVVGPFEGRWATERAIINPGGQLIVYTDGIPEARGPADFFGLERLAEAVASGPSKATALVAELLERAKDHAEGRLTDDATALVVSRDEPPDEAQGQTELG